jgi:hypothetical protein
VHIIARVIRRLIVRLVSGVVRRHRLVAGLAFVLIAGIIAVSALNVSLPPLEYESAAPGTTSHLANQDEPNATANYLRGQQSYDAKLVWDAYSDRVIRDLQRRGSSQEDTQRQLDRAREVGRKIEQAQYIGGYPIPNGSMHFYVVMQTSPRTTSARGDIAYVPYAFTLDTRGKIERVE